MNGCELIAQERKRQIEVEGWTAEHDAEHHPGELASAGRAYALQAYWQIFPYMGWTKEQLEEEISENEWPWSSEWWKPSEDPIRNLVKAGAIDVDVDRMTGILAQSNYLPKEIWLTGEPYSV
jgi:hypothetical protein